MINTTNVQHVKSWFAGCLGLLIVTSSVAAQASGAERRWLQQLDEADRRPLDRLVGQAPPPFAEELQWHHVERAPDWQAMRERVVVIQSWSHANEQSVTALKSAAEIAGGFSDIDVAFIGLHTPEKADTAAEFLKRAKYDHTIAIDPKGAFCDDLGVYKQPVNIVIDRHGAVRYAGLTLSGLQAALDRLVDEMYDPARCPQPYGEGGAEFPKFTNAVGTTRDVRGEQAPPFQVQHWVTDEVDVEDSVVVIAFWATWCGPCINTIPHINQLASAFDGEATFVGISNEPLDRLQNGMQRRNLTAEGFNYAIGTDPEGAMYSHIGVRGIPHGIVMSRDWVVRWQGHPARLTESDLRQIIEADRGDAKKAPGRWLASR